MHAPKWVFPRTVEETLAAIANGEGRPVAGGTTILDLLKLGHAQPVRLVDVTRLPLSQIRHDNDALWIGATASNTAVANALAVKSDFPALSQAILSGASQQIRNAATVGGNLMQATRCVYFRSTDWPCNRRKPGSGCEAIRSPMANHAILGGSTSCIATHPSDMAVALRALDAIIHIRNEAGEKRIALDEFYPLPGGSPERQTSLPSDAVIIGIELPRTAAATRSAYIKLRGRASYEFATASVAAAVSLDGSVVRSLAIALGGVATVPWRCREAEALLIGEQLTEATINRFIDQLLAGAEPRPQTQHKIGLARGAIHRILEELAAR